MAVAAALSRMVRDGRIRRLRKGVYARPRETRFGAVLPTPETVARAILKSRGIKATAGGLAAFNSLGLTTQVPSVVTLDVEKKTGALGGATSKVRIKTVPRVRGMKAEERGVLDALAALKKIPDTTPVEVFGRVADLFKSGRLSYSRVAEFAENEPPRVRALVGALGSLLREGLVARERLKRSLNGTTHFDLGIVGSVPEARSWQIR